MTFYRRSKWIDFFLLFFSTAILIAPQFRAKYLDHWSSIESSFIADGRFLAANLPHPGWLPLWYCGTRFDYVYPPVLRYGTALLTSIWIPIKAYHVFSGAMYCFGIAGVYFLARMMQATRVTALISAAACALVSPTFLLISDVRHDAPWMTPQRLGVMLRYGEGPHISSLSLLPYAMGFSFLALRKRPGAIVFAGIFCALAALTNFYGATALAFFYPVMVWSVWVVYRERGILLRGISIPALAWGLSAFWITPSYVRITLHNMRYIAQPGNSFSVWALLITAVLFAAVSIRWSRGKAAYSDSPWFVFITGAMVFEGLLVLGNHYFNFRLIGEPLRFIPELDMAIILTVVEVLRRLLRKTAGSRLPNLAVRCVAVVVAIAALLPASNFIRHAWKIYPPEPDYRQRVEYRMSEWVATHMPGSRTLVTGSVRFWWDVWHDLPEVEGGTDQALLNDNVPIAAWEIASGNQPERAVRWLESMGADAVIVSDSTSQEIYHDFQFPNKFVGLLPVLYDDHLGNVIYRVPRKYPGIARVVNTAQSKAGTAVTAENYLPPLYAYADLVERGPDSPAGAQWNGTDSVSVNAVLHDDESILLQETYDPSWHAYSGNHELPIRQDSMDFMAIDAPPGQYNVVFRFETPLEKTIGYFISSAALIFCLVLSLVTLRMQSALDPAHYPIHLRLLRAFLRGLHNRSRLWPEIPEKLPFDPDKLARAQTALATLPGVDKDAAYYLSRHTSRHARTLALVPPPQTTGRVLELGCYMQITPFLQTLCDYREVRGGYLGPSGKIDHKILDIPGSGEFSCYIDHFDVERDVFPYPDEYFDLVIAAEILEHMTSDPMWMLLEARRVLIDGGYLLLSTPNIGSVASMAKTLYGRDNPQIYSHYDRIVPGRVPEVPHVREYTLQELGIAVRAAGFEIELLSATTLEEYAAHRPSLHYLALQGLDYENRGEQSWCLARKRSDLPVDRFPHFLYAP